MKIDRLKTDLAKAKEKAAEWQARVRDLEKQITEQENLEILQVVRGVAASPEELRSARGVRIGVPYWYRLIGIILAVSFLSFHGIYDTCVTFLDVGQGDGIWIESISGKHYLIDGGSTSESQIGQYTLLPFLKFTGTSRLDAVFLTHLDEDHISGVRELLEGYEEGGGASA